MTLIDYTTRCWGHNLSVTQGPDGLLNGFCWYSGRVNVFDYVKWRTAYGTATARVESVARAQGVDDMWEITLHVTDRQMADEPTGVIAQASIRPGL